MKLAETSYDNSETGCCARLDPATWDGKEFRWEDKPVLQDQVRSFLNIPLNFGSVMKRTNEAIESAAAYTDDPICLTEHASPWRSNVLLTVDRDVPGASIDELSGTFLTRVFEGPYRLAGKWQAEMKEYAKSMGHEVERIYFYYSACPKCARRFGKNYVVLFAKVR